MDKTEMKSRAGVGGETAAGPVTKSDASAPDWTGTDHKGAVDKVDYVGVEKKDKAEKFVGEETKDEEEPPMGLVLSGRVQCSECGAEEEAGRLEQHVNTHHLDYYPFSCGHCLVCSSCLLCLRQRNRLIGASGFEGFNLQPRRLFCSALV